MALWNEPEVVAEAFSINSAKSVMNLSNPYRVGSGELTVFYNGLIAVLGIDYNEVNPYTIQFQYACQPGDTVICHIRRLG